MTLQIESDRQQSVDVEFRTLTFRVTSKTEPDGVFEILRGLDGKCRSGRLLALMGPSGSGKTTLLDVLAGNVYGGRVEGQILINGAAINSLALARLSCYVMQHPVLLSSATVKESLMTSALLRLSKSVSRSEKERLVTDIMEELGLTECANVLVGNEQEDIKGISGGQMRRLAVGVELVTRPRLILLDEPTSGLDSEIALTLMQTLKALAMNRRTVACSIHQPNSDIVDTFDDLHLLSHGRTVYAGPWIDAVTFFTRAGFECPKYKNPTDYFMAVLKEKGNDELISNRFLSERANIEAEGAMDLSLTSSPTGNDGGDRHAGLAPAAVPWWFQACILWIRFFKTWMRNPILFWSEFSQYVFTGVFTGLMYYNLSDSLNFGATDRFSSQFFILAFLLFIPAYGAVTLWDNERKLVKVETNRKSYSIFSYFLAKTATTWPMEIGQCLVMALIVYWMIGYQSGADKFFVFYATVVLFQLLSESLGLFAAFITSKSQYAIVLLSMVFLVLISFTGFVVRDIPVYFKWVKRIAYVSFATAALVKSELNGIQLEHPNGTFIDANIFFTDQPFLEDDLMEATREDIDVLSNSLSVAENCWVLFAQLMGLRALCFFALVMAARLRFL